MRPRRWPGVPALLALALIVGGCGLEPEGPLDPVLGPTPSPPFAATADPMTLNPLRPQLRSLSLGGRTLEVEDAGEADGQERGLMFRESLGVDEGMWFSFPFARVLAFWMKDTSIPISVAFVAPDGAILNIEDMEPFDLTLAFSEGRAQHALEMNRGWFARNGIEPGTRVVIGAIIPRDVPVEPTDPR